MEKVKKIFLFYFSWRFLTLLIAHLATFYIPFRPQFTAGKYGMYLPYLLGVWGNFDGYHYMEIAERGYAQFEQPFFPLYPLLIGALTKIFDWPYLFSGEFISNICFVFSLVIIYKLLTVDKGINLVNIFFLILILYPTSMFYGAVYNDSLFLLLASMTLLLGRYKKWGWASIIAALASLARLNGLALFFYLVFEYWDKKPFKKKFNIKEILKNKIYSVILIPLTFIGYYLYTQYAYGNNILFSSMKIWRQEKPVIPLQVFWRYLKIFFMVNPGEFVYWVAVVEFAFAAFYVFLLIYSFKKIRLSYWIFMIMSFLIPSLTGTFTGMPRYALHIYPFFLAVSIFLKERSLFIKVLYFVLSIALMIFFIGFFTRGYFVT